MIFGIEMDENTIGNVIEHNEFKKLSYIEKKKLTQILLQTIVDKYMYSDSFFIDELEEILKEVKGY